MGIKSFWVLLKAASILSILVASQGCTQLIWEAVQPPDIPYSKKCLTNIPSDKGRVFVYFNASAGRTSAEYAAGMVLGGVGTKPSTVLYIDNKGTRVIHSEKFSFVDLTVGKYTFHTTPNLEDGENNKTMEIKEGGQPYFVKITTDENLEVIDQTEAKKELAEYVFDQMMGRISIPPCLKK